MVGSGPLVNRNRIVRITCFFSQMRIHYFLMNPTYNMSLFDILFLFLNPLHEKTCDQYIKEDGKSRGGCSEWVYDGKYPLSAHPMVVPETRWRWEGSGRGDELE